jgi:hypothetical protein
MKTSIKSNLNALHLSDIYSLMLFIIYKLQDVSDYAVLSELCYLLDGNNLTRLLTYFAGRTITIPTEEEFAVLTNALLVYQYVNLDGMSLTNALMKLEDVTPKEKEKITDLYVKILAIMKDYNVDRGQIQNGLSHR